MKDIATKVAVAQLKRRNATIARGEKVATKVYDAFPSYPKLTTKQLDDMEFYLRNS